MHSAKKLPQDFFKNNVRDNSWNQRDNTNNENWFQENKSKLPLKEKLAGSRNKSSKMIVRKGSWNAKECSINQSELDSLKYILTTANGNNNIKQDKRLNIKPVPNQLVKKDIISINDGFNTYQQNSMQLRAINSHQQISNKISQEELKDSEIMSNLKVIQNNQNLYSDNDIRLFHDLYNKNSLVEGKLYSKNSRKSSRDSRGIKLQENGIKALGMKFVVPPVKQSIWNEESSENHSGLLMKGLKRNYDLSNKFRTISEMRNFPISVQNSQYELKESITDKNEFTISLKK